MKPLPKIVQDCIDNDKDGPQILYALEEWAEELKKDSYKKGRKSGHIKGWNDAKHTETQ